MENKKLLKLLRKDMNELEELIKDVKLQGNFNPLEMEFIHTRAKGIMQIIELLNVNDEKTVGNVPVQDEKLKQIKETVSATKEDITDSAEASHETKKTEDKTEISAPKEKIHEERKPEQEVEQEQNVKNEKEEPTGKPSGTKNDDVLEEDAGKQDAGSRLGDSFLKGKSLNDLVTGKYKLEFKLSNRPVKSIKSAIGINDRFQYIRELFNGNPEKFTETVNALDSMNNIQEAVVYLRENFRWKKNETSLKFVNLVKRRFQNEQ